MKIPNGGVAVFDSGIGGLTVLAECEKRINGEYFYYYGDNGHAPYGNLTAQEIEKLVFRVFNRFKRLKVKAAVVACNTVTATCIERLRQRYAFPIIGAEPAVFSAAKGGGRVLVLTTKATFDSERFHCLVERAAKCYPQAEILPVACPQLAGAIEKHLTDTQFDFSQLLPNVKADAVVLGCTHYIYIVETVRNFYGCKVYDGNEGIVNRLRAVLGLKNVGGGCEVNSTQKTEPKSVFLSKNVAPVTTENHKQIFAPFCFDFNVKKTPKLPRNEKNQKTFFLGKYKGFNAKIHERMFVFKQNGCESAKSGF